MQDHLLLQYIFRVSRQQSLRFPEIRTAVVPRACTLQRERKVCACRMMKGGSRLQLELVRKATRVF